ncbi:hypothetical protein NU219Hw_g6255t1 [Hortaea werneckii]
MPTHEEHLAGIEEATGRLRTLKVKFNNAENDWCEAGKQLQRVRDLRQKYIDEHGFAPPNPLMQPLLQPVQKFYTRKAKEYLAGRVQNVRERRTESACGSSSLPGLTLRSVKDKKKLSVGNEKKKLSVRDERKKLSVEDEKKKKPSVRNKLEPKPGHARDEKKSSGRKKLNKSRPGTEHKPDKKNRPEDSAHKPNRNHESDSTSKPNRKPASDRSPNPNPNLIPSPTQSTTPPHQQNPTEPSPPPKQLSNGEPASWKPGQRTSTARCKPSPLHHPSPAPPHRAARGPTPNGS